MKLSDLVVIATLDLEKYGDMDVSVPDHDGDPREVYEVATYTDGHSNEFVINWR